MAQPQARSPVRQQAREELRAHPPMGCAQHARCLPSSAQPTRVLRDAPERRGQRRGTYSVHATAPADSLQCARPFLCMPQPPPSCTASAAEGRRCHAYRACSCDHLATSARTSQRDFRTSRVHCTLLPRHNATRPVNRRAAARGDGRRKSIAFRGGERSESRPRSGERRITIRSLVDCWNTAFAKQELSHTMVADDTSRRHAARPIVGRARPRRLARE